MKIKLTSYRTFTKAVATLLLVMMLLPYALQAKQLTDFCMMDMMTHQEMMDDSHDCSLMDEDGHDATHKNHHDCEDAQICACSVDTTLANTQFRVPTTTSATIILPQNGFNFIVNSPDEFIYEDYFAAARQHSPPLYLLYDTFLN